MKAALVVPSARPAMPRNEADRTTALVQALHDPACYPHPVDSVEVVETHISQVLLAGEFAYKIKKPVCLSFLDFSTLALRRHYCEEELRLNRRTAPDVYLDVVTIAGNPAAPRVAGTGPALEYAVRMRRFPQRALFSQLAQRRRLRRAHVDALADRVAAFHARAERMPCSDDARGIAEAALANFSDLHRLEPPPHTWERAEPLRRWTRLQLQELAPILDARGAAGFRRECHGDLHLGNVALIDACPVLFDCLEFSEGLRRIDVMNDAAFAVMDLEHVGLARHAARFVNRYVERTGDHRGLAVLRFYKVYRAMVRAKVACIRLRQALVASPQARAAEAELLECLDLAARMSHTPQPALILMHGLSASGKTTASQGLLEALGAVRLRSDVERKRLHRIDAQAVARAAPGQGIYTERDNRDTYDRLATLARAVLDSRHAVIVDATFLKRADRERFRHLAAAAGAAFRIVACEAPEAVLRARVAAREAAGGGVSDAGLAVLESQLARLEPLGEDERAYLTRLDTADPLRWKGAVEALARGLRAG